MLNILHPFLVHFALTLSLLVIIRWMGFKLFPWIPDRSLKWTLAGFLVITVISGQYAFSTLAPLSPRMILFLEWHRALAVGATTLLLWHLFGSGQRPSSEMPRKNLTGPGKNRLVLPVLASLLLLAAASIGGILVHSLRVGVPPQI